jgi:hypothetical protein
MHSMLWANLCDLVVVGFLEYVEAVDFLLGLCNNYVC